MDIPDLEELEWLESHTLDEQFDDDFELEIEPPSPPSSPEPNNPPTRPTLSLPPKPSPINPHPQINSIAKKRARSNLPDSTLFDADNNSDPDKHGKRIRTEEDESQNKKWAPPEISLNEKVGSVENSGRRDDDDDEWLRCSPPRDVEVEMEVVEREREERILSRYATEIEGDCVPVTGLDGERVYAKICSAVMDAEERRNKLSVRGEFNGLLREPARVLMQKFEQEEFTKALQASVEGPTEVVPPKAPVTHQQLWVDKYAPSSFTELLSDEQTNREVLLWLKQWDSCVFGSDIKSTTEDVLSALRRHSSGSQHPKQSTKSYSGTNRGTRSNYFGSNRETRFSRDNLRAHNELDKGSNISHVTPEIWDKRQKGFGHPEQKILLLCGPPGLGKTTLAHVAARHCGYRVVEINASDDRSSSVIEAKILDVVQMNSVISDSKPKCLVIDEIDGALGDGKGAVEIILKLISAEKKSDAGKENVAQDAHSGRKSSHKKQRNSLLLRPVICICNDLYAPALRPLRQVAKVHIFVQPTVSRVVNRLKYICNKEGVKTSSIALTALAEYTECDIRSCLNTLQFLNKKKEILNVLEISSQVVGRKDVSKSAFDVWKEIFQKRKGKRDRNSNNSGSSMSKDFEYLYSVISNRGDYDLIFDGIHENILQLHYVDPMMQKTVQCLDNLVVSDITHRYIMRTQQMSLLAYQPPLAIVMHSLIAQLEKKDIEWPKSFHRHRTVLAERMDMFHAWHNRISPYISRHLSTKSFVEDSISPMLHILSPPTLRPVALHLLSNSEKSYLGQLVNIMVSYAITYKNIKFDRSGISRHEDALDASTLSLDPPISEFIHLKGYNSCHFDLALAVKQVLVHEVEKQKILLGSISKSTHLHVKENHGLEKNTGNGVSSKSSYINKSSAETKMKERSPIIEQSGLSVSSSSSVAESGGGAIQVKSVQKTKKPSGGVTSFFDRFRKVSHEGSRNTNNVVQRGGTVQRDSHPLLFKFNEGFTNAVKRPVRVREFLL
ncbi:hypothetical protein BUALT_Bualt12G0099600 [Buddleja alternifolia]|uniref:Chromosome transmission fidelity protein 18 homolog n=1 Tax=Buddleja alternifolia TaxID=168488 RepID=A0AAV6WRC6_9LAMI|nr:hypothetical protein BUALT_Bualt12G0099600 [Buddleja alternifolia]